MKKLLFAFTILSTLILLSCSDSGTGPNPESGGDNNEQETPTYNVSVNINPADVGTISPSADSTYEEGEEIELQATPNERYVFTGWSGDVDSTSDNPLSLTVDKDYSIKANFEIKSYQLTVNIQGKGSVSEEVLEQKAKDYEHGTVVELTANPAEGYKFVEWQDAVTGSANPVQITVDESKNVKAVFEKKSYSLTVKTDGGGSVDKNPDQTEYKYNSNVELTANPAKNWKFIEWSGTVSGSENPIHITIDEAKEVTAVFEEVRTELEGIISSDTTLGLSDSPYELIGKVQIAYGAELRVEKGVEIYGESQSNDESNVVEVFGKLLIQGTNSDKVLIKNIEIQPGDNSNTELFKIEIHHVNMIGGELYSSSGSIYGSITLKNSLLYKVNSGYSFMDIWYPEESSYIESNIFYNSGRIYTLNKDANTYIRNNLFFQNETFVSERGYAVENAASYGSSKTVVKYNTFVNTEEIAVSLPSGYEDASLDATENYWNTTSPDVIQDMIFDKNDDLSVNEEIPFDPFLDSPDSNTPVLPDSLK